MVHGPSSRSSGSKNSEGTADEPSPRAPDVCYVAIGGILPADTPRLAGEDEDHVRRLAETDAPLPPILVHRSTMRVIDGMHRLRAAMLRDWDKIAVEFFDGTEVDAFIRAVEANVTHGLPLSLADRRVAAARIIVARPALSDRAIATLTGLSAKTVKALRHRSTDDWQQSNIRVGSDGRLRPLSGSDGRRRAAEIIAQKPNASLREIARAAGVSLGTAHDVRERIRCGKDPVRPGARRAAERSELDGNAGSVVRTRRNEGRSPGDAGDMNSGSVLQKLSKDPSLRQTDAGRELLRWLHRRAVVTDDWSVLVHTIPAHCVDIVADLARMYAASWQEFAQEVERHNGTRG